MGATPHQVDFLANVVGREIVFSRDAHLSFNPEVLAAAVDSGFVAASFWKQADPLAVNGFKEIFVAGAFHRKNHLGTPDSLFLVSPSQFELMGYPVDHDPE